MLTSAQVAYIGCKGLRIAVTDAPGNTGPIYWCPALVGSDVCRTAGRVGLQIIDGEAYLPGWYEDGPVALVAEGPLRGWGQLDCEVSYAFGTANLPSQVVDALTTHCGLRAEALTN